VYNDALKKIEDWILQYFDASDARVAAVTTTLIELKQKDIGLVLPEELNAQPLIANYLKKQISLREKDQASEDGKGQEIGKAK
jgi:uroporphyrin-3 C-methyltransferase